MAIYNLVGGIALSTSPALYNVQSGGILNRGGSRISGREVLEGMRVKCAKFFWLGHAPFQRLDPPLLWILDP